MTPSLTRRRLLGAFAVGLSAVSAGCGGALSAGTDRTEFDREIEADAERITVEADNGDARVSRTDAEAVRVRGIKETGSVFTALDDLTIETARDGDRLQISTDTSGGSFLGLGGGSISLDVGVPDGIAVERVAAGNGVATATTVAGDVELEATNGMARASDVDGSVSLASTNGSLSAHEIAGLDGAETTNGDVDVAIPAIDSDVSVLSMNGTVIAALSPDLDATVVASTENGSVNADDLPFEKDGAADTLRGTLGDGTHELTVETTNGSVLLTRLLQPA